MGLIMKKIILTIVLLLLISVMIPCEAEEEKKCGFTDMPSDFIKKLNEFVYHFTKYNDLYVTRAQIDTEECTYWAADEEKHEFVYSCPINPATSIDIITDLLLYPQWIRINGTFDKTHVPTKTSYEWAFFTTQVFCSGYMYPEVQDMFIDAWTTGYYENDDVKMLFGENPYNNEEWGFIIDIRK